MSHSTKHKHKEKNQTTSSISKKSRKKAFWLLIILGVVIMLVYAVSFQEAEDSELLQETQNIDNQP